MRYKLHVLGNFSLGVRWLLIINPPSNNISPSVKLKYIDWPNPSRPLVPYTGRTRLKQENKLVIKCCVVHGLHPAEFCLC